VANETAIPIDEDLLRSWPLPAVSGDKSERGTVLVVGGSPQTPGAVALAAEAALRVGAGKVQIATAADTAAALAVALPEAFVEGLPVLRGGELAVAGSDRILELAEDVDVVLLGPGLSSPESANLLMAQVVPHLNKAVVIDALGTAYLTGNLDGVRHLDGRVLLTPNVAELAATLHQSESDVTEDPLAATRKLAGETGAVVLGGAQESYVATPQDEVWRLDRGSPGLATAGSGDVKAGAVVGLVARGASPQQAAAWAAWAHGRAGERLAAEAPGFLARDLLAAIPVQLARLERDDSGGR
jgi:hydroxyethylthiazole kinase-like uncharacterized protein yjeF